MHSTNIVLCISLITACIVYRVHVHVCMHAKLNANVNITDNILATAVQQQLLPLILHFCNLCNAFTLYSVPCTLYSVQLQLQSSVEARCQ